MFDDSTSPLSATVNEIMTAPGPAPFFEWELTFKVLEGSPVDLTDPNIVVTVEESDGFFKPTALTNIDFVGDFEKNYADHVSALCQVSIGMWLKVLSPARSFLRVYLIRKRLLDVDGPEDYSDDPVVYVFKPIFKDQDGVNDSIGTVTHISRFELDLRGIVPLDFDLLDPSLEAAQTAKCGGNWRNVKASDVMQAVFANVCAQFDFEQEPLFTGQFIAKDTNENKRSHITIDSNTDLTNLPLLLQANHGGIWPAGINRFLLDKIWYFYPPYDTTRFEKEKKTFTIALIPEMGTSFATRTFFMDGEHLKIIGVGSVNYRDTTQQKFLKEGDGLRFTEASPIALDWVEVKDNKAIASRGKHNSEMRISDESKTDHRIFQGNQRFTDNPYAQMSILAAKRGIIVNVQWNYCDHTLLTPGMPGRLLFEHEQEIIELECILISRHAGAQTTQQGVKQGNFINTTILTLFCNPTPKDTVY